MRAFGVCMNVYVNEYDIYVINKYIHNEFNMYAWSINVSMCIYE